MQAIEWLGEALARNFPAPSMLDTDPELAPLRSYAEFQALREE